MSNFFKKLFSQPSLLWKLGFGLVFVSLGITLIFAPEIVLGKNTANKTLANMFSVLFILYGGYRLVTFYLELKSLDDEEE